MVGFKVKRGRSGALRNSVLTLFILFFLSGCASQFVYNRIDWLTKYQIEKYIDLDKEQERFVKASMDSVLGWHRGRELTRYIDFLERLKLALKEDISAEQVVLWLDDVRLAYDDLLVVMSPWLIDLAASLSSEQVEELMINMQEQNQEFEKEYLQRDARGYAKSIDKRLQRSFKYWLGPLSKQQKEQIGKTVASLERLDEEWMQGRKKWQGQLLLALARNKGWENDLAVLLRDGAGYTQPAAEQASDRNVKRISKLVANVINIRSEKQNQKILKKIAKWQKDIASIRDNGGARENIALSERNSSS